MGLDRLRGRVAIVTGAGQGIGAAISWRLGLEGCRIAIAEVDREAGTYRERWLRDRGIEAVFIETDVSSEESVRSMVEETYRTYGRIDILVNNAGIGIKPKPIFQQTLEEWSRVINTNLTGAYLCAKYAAEKMARGGGGVIINIASTRAYQSEENTEPYSASKGGLIALTHSLAVSLGRYGIRVISISPGWIDTSRWRIRADEEELTPLDHKQHPAGRVGRPEDIANLVAFLASDEASWITGVDIVVDGGMTRRMIYLDEGVIAGAVEMLTGDRELSEAVRRLVELRDRGKVREVLDRLKNIL